MKYKIYVVRTSDVTKVATFEEADFNWGCGCDSVDEALFLLKRNGDDCVTYTILPYIYMSK